jgi:hypothetical protein
MAGAVPAGGWGLLGVQVEVEVVGKQDSLAAAVPRGMWHLHAMLRVDRIRRIVGSGSQIKWELFFCE